MVDATRNTIRAAKETAQRLQFLEDQHTRLDSEVTAIHGKLDNQQTILLDIARHQALNDSPPPDRSPATRAMDSGLNDEVSQLLPTIAENATKRVPFGPNRAVKADLPRFHGDNSSSWLFRAEQFFSYYETSKSQRLLIASIYLDGPAIAWIQSIHQRGLLTTWTEFTTSLLARFGPLPFRDLRGELAKLPTTHHGAVIY